MHAGYAERIEKGSFKITPENLGFAVPGGMKDVGHVIELGKASGVSMPVAEVTMGHLKEVNAMEGGNELDWGAVAVAIRQAAGLPP